MWSSAGISVRTNTIIYINDIFRNSDLFQYMLFADDTYLIFQHKNLNQILQIANQEITKVSQ